VLITVQPRAPGDTVATIASDVLPA